MISLFPSFASGKPWLSCLLMGATLLLASCGTTSRVEPSNPGFVVYTQAVSAVEQWQLTGRLTARQDNNSDRVSLNWKQDSNTFDITLWGTLGLGNTRISGSDQGLVIEKADEVPVQLPNLEALSREYLNFDFPAAYLVYWVRGLAVPDLASDLTFDANNLLTTMSQTDTNGRKWDLSFDRYGPAGDFNLPGRVRINSGDIQLVFIIDDWQYPTTADN